MITVVEPQKHIVALWGKTKITDKNKFRLMRYTMRIDYQGHVLLQNTVTGQLVLLSREEISYIDNLPDMFTSVAEQLVDGHYLVPVDFDEHQQVVNMRHILRRLDQSNTKYVHQYRIFPTTACNARCYYCFEQGMQVATMTEDTARKVVEFIVKNTGPDKKVRIMWFGGEPTVASDRINQICSGLTENGIAFRSDMTTNGYLFDKEMIERAASIWHLKGVQITVDGTETNYNKIKSYRNVSGNPYKRVLNNIEMLLDKHISVGMRMNFDIANYQDFKNLVDEAVKRFHKNPYLNVSAYPIVGEYKQDGNIVPHGSEEWFAEKMVELNEYARRVGVARPKKILPSMRYIGCEADNDMAIGINPHGRLIKCGECFEDNQSIGNLQEGITNYELVSSWKSLADYQKCVECAFFPVCIRLGNCSAGDSCQFQDRNRQFELSMQMQYKNWINREK